MHVVYFIRCGGFIKIGWTSNLLRRLATLQMENPERLEIIRQVPGSRVLERAFHQHFAKHRIRGEWFCFVEEMLTATAADIEKVPGRLALKEQTSMFRLWRQRMGYTQEQAATVLHYSDRRIRSYDTGEDIPPMHVRLAMVAIEHNLQPVRFSYEDDAA